MLAVAKRVDAYENWAVIIYVLQLPTVCLVGLNALVLGSYAGVGTHPLEQHAPLFVAIPILLAEALYALRLVLHVRALQGRTGFGGRPHTALPTARLVERLKYLVFKYSDHAPYWQARAERAELARASAWA